MRAVERFEVAVSEYTWKGSFSEDPQRYARAIEEYYAAKKALIELLEKRQSV